MYYIISVISVLLAYYLCKLFWLLLLIYIGEVTIYGQTYKNILVCRHPGRVFFSTPGWLEKTIIILRCKIFDRHVSCRPARMTANQHIFKSGVI